MIYSHYFVPLNHYVILLFQLYSLIVPSCFIKYGKNLEKMFFEPVQINAT